MAQFPKIVSAYIGSGCQVPARDPEVDHASRVVDGKVNGRIGPDRYWTREINNIINAFPEISHWELSNEYDLPADNAKVEEQIDWANYRAYHTAVRQHPGFARRRGSGRGRKRPGRHLAAARAALHPERRLRKNRRCQLASLLRHRRPETSLCNFNMGSEDKLPSLLFDDLRAVKRAAQADGKHRQSWLTEFGWDTLAGPVVSAYQQAVYLPRAWMMAMAAGTDKAFWFYNFDAPNPKQFFDGCGLLNAKGEPKLSLCSMAGLTSVLPNPVYVGDLDAGENTCGYVFRNDRQACRLAVDDPRRRRPHGPLPGRAGPGLPGQPD